MRTAPRIVEAGLWVIAAASAFWATLWVLGVNGLGVLSLGVLPRWFDEISLYGANAGWTAIPSVPVRLGFTETDGIRTYFLGLDEVDRGNVPAHFGSLVPGASRVLVQDPSALQTICYLALQLAGLLGVAFIAITLARLVAESRGESPFVQRNVTRLRRIGVLLLVGAPLASFAHWACERWMVESSSVGDRVSVYGYGLSSLPIWTMLVGGAVLVLADVWKRGVRMAYDVRGLV
jgi:hypothetical protein